MSTLRVTDTNDLYISPGNSMVMLTGIDGAGQSCKHYAQSRKGEMVFQVDLGVDYFGAAFDHVNLQEFRDSLISNIRRQPETEDVPQCSVEQIADTIQYSAVIQTIYGVGTINES